MYVVYRGIALDEYPPGFTGEPGSPVPKELIYPNGSQLVIHATHSETEAASYAQGKKIALVYQMEVGACDVIFDSINVERILSVCPLPSETLDYFRTTQEVLIRRDVEITATAIKTE